MKPYLANREIDLSEKETILHFDSIANSDFPNKSLSIGKDIHFSNATKKTAVNRETTDDN